MALYRLKRGQKHFHRTVKGNVKLSPGDTIELNPDQAKALRDKFELVAEAPPKKQEVSEKASPKTPQVVPHPTEEGKFNVLHGETGEVLNDEPLEEFEANLLATSN